MFAGLAGFQIQVSIFKSVVDIRWVYSWTRIHTREHKFRPISVLVGFGIRGYADISYLLPSLNETPATCSHSPHSLSWCSPKASMHACTPEHHGCAYRLPSPSGEKRAVPTCTLGPEIVRFGRIMTSRTRAAHRKEEESQRNGTTRSGAQPGRSAFLHAQATKSSACLEN